MLLRMPHLVFARKSGQHFAQLARNYMQVTANGRLLHGGKFPIIDSIVASQSSKIQLTSDPLNPITKKFVLFPIGFRMQATSAKEYLSLLWRCKKQEVC